MPIVLLWSRKVKKTVKEFGISAYQMILRQTNLQVISLQTGAAYGLVSSLMANLRKIHLQQYI